MPRSSVPKSSALIPANVAKLEKILGIKFKNLAVLEEALTHKSYAMERGRQIPFNERLEFLGDSVLSSAVAHYLFGRYPNEDEGKLSQLKSMIVSRQNLTTWGRDITLGDYLLLSDGEDATGGRTRDSILGNAMEALLGAMFLEAGFEKTEKFIHKILAKRKRFVTLDYKSRLQEWAQKRYKIPPEYVLTDTSGPDHAKIFTMQVSVSQNVLGSGSGKSKKEAEQIAARDALRKIKTSA